MKYAAPFLLLALLLSGCAGQQRFEARMRAKKAASLEAYGGGGITAVVPFPEREGSETEVRTIEPVNFLNIHSGGLAIGEELTDEMFAKSFGEHQETATENGMTFKVNFQGAGGLAACAPVTGDGYFVTAGHTQDYTNAYIIYATSDDEHTFLMGARCRLVERREAQDWAIIKADMATPRYLRIRTAPVKEGEVLFGGNAWRGYCAAGTVLRGAKYTYSAGDQRFRIKLVPLKEGDPAPWALWVSLPTLNGDSGSPVVDAHGELCGIVVGGYEGLGRRWWDGSVAVRIDAAAVMDVIARDRAAATRSGE